MGLEGKEQPFSGPQVSSHGIFRQRKSSLLGWRGKLFPLVREAPPDTVPDRQSHLDPIRGPHCRVQDPILC